MAWIISFFEDTEIKFIHSFCTHESTTMSFTPLFPSASHLPPQKNGECHVINVGQSYKSIAVNSTSDTGLDVGQRHGKESSAKSQEKKESKKRKRHKSKSDKHHRRPRRDKGQQDRKHSKQKTTLRKSSDEEWSSIENSDDDHNSCDYKEKSGKKLFLPNGQYMFKEENDSQKQHSGENTWTINPNGDYSVFQFGVYRLDIPSYDLYVLSAKTAANKFLSSDYCKDKSPATIRGCDHILVVFCKGLLILVS